MINQLKFNDQAFRPNSILPSLSPVRQLNLSKEVFPLSTRNSQETYKKESKQKKQQGILPPLDKSIFKSQNYFPAIKKHPETMRESTKKYFMGQNQAQEMEQKSNLVSQGIIKAYAANTNSGIVRSYNEDRVSIIFRASKTQAGEIQSCLFSVYDGHGGQTCAEFLRDNLHQFIFEDSCFPTNPKEALINGFRLAEQKFLQKAFQHEMILDSSGSCACSVLIVKDVVYVANVGDSRAVMSISQGNKICQLSNDHKPIFEKKRIQQAGGQIYQAQGLSKMIQSLIP